MASVGESTSTPNEMMASTWDDPLEQQDMAAHLIDLQQKLLLVEGRADCLESTKEGVGERSKKKKTKKEGHIEGLRGEMK
jgi:hypothetical protein